MIKEMAFTINGKEYADFIDTISEVERCCFNCLKLIRNECPRPYISDDDAFIKVSGCSYFENRNT